MSTIFIIHGSFGNPSENWFPWLKSKLEELGHEVFVPTFPTPDEQSLENWLKVFEPYKSKIKEDTIFVGHSLGPAFILSILEKINTKIKSAFFVSGFISKIANPDFEEINKTFVEKEFDWKKIKQNCNKFTIFHSDNDPYVPIEKVKELILKLDPKNVDFFIVPKAGHFNKESGFTDFESLLKEVKKII
ncbi:serine hydrolase family protein [Candidatus Woesearchaeota archaeon]|jgi:uncharacterized protein|nr:serine hydrolase family protein [Candidatus Woesearchaeota archaeon]MBT6520019.1 serine hydrolase family protein [Candidatus Woesearchaeota archaeon]MBT7368602.1 serine hydrolase family protein [Candidatus Woesearchaeota archaeon]